MSIPRKTTISCPKCGKRFETLIFDSLNTDYSSDIATKIISGELFDAKCPKCSNIAHLEYDMLYHDLKHNAMIWVGHTNSENYDSRVAEIRATPQLPDYMTRIVPDMNALREKVACLEADVDDQVMELFKLLLEHQLIEQNPDFKIRNSFFTYAENKLIVFFYDTSGKEMHCSFEYEQYDAFEDIYRERLLKMGKKPFQIIDRKWAIQFYKELPAEEIIETEKNSLEEREKDIESDEYNDFLEKYSKNRTGKTLSQKKQDEFAAFLQNYAKDAPKTAVPQTEESGSVSVTPKEITESDQNEENVTRAENHTEPGEVLYESLNPMLLGGFPVILVMSMVIKQGTQIFARCSFLSISDKPIRAMQINMLCYNVWHEGIRSVNGFEYLDLKVDRDQSFGADTVLPLPDPATRSIDIVIDRIAFADGTLLQSSGADNTAIPELILLEKSLGSSELVHEYASKTYQNVKYMPVRFGNFWRCTCGAINREDELICHKCADTAEILFENLDQKTLQASIDKKKQIQKEKEEQEQIEREEARRKAEEEETTRRIKEAAEAQERAEKRKIRWKRFVIISSIIVAMALAVYLIGWQAIPAWKYNQAEKLLLAGDRDGAYSTFLGLVDYRDSYSRAYEIKYEDAVSALSNGDFDSAFYTFNSIADYKDSQIQAKEAIYRKAMAALNHAEFDTAHEAFSSISGYQDCDTMAKEAIYKKATVAFYKKDYDGAYTAYSSISDYGDSAIKAKESIYKKAVLLMESKSFQEAAVCFDLITDYRDSQAQSTICRNELDYLDATELLNRGSYSKAGECFELLGSYRDSDELMRKAYYLSAKELIDMGVLRGAYSVLSTKVNTDNRSYEDSVDLANSIGYQYADNCFNEGQYYAAMSIFEELADYEDSSARYLETKYQYGLSLIDDGRYEEAEQLFKELDNYKDSQTQNKEARYQRALVFLNKSEYTKAESLFEDLGTYKDSATQLKEAKYLDAITASNSLFKQYKRAAEIFKELGNYKDSADRWKATMYAYVQANKNNNDKTTYEFLTELKARNYQDSKTLYESLFAWSATIVINDSSTDRTTSMESLTTYDEINCHFVLYGGPPGEIVALKAVGYWPDGNTTTIKWNGDNEWERGSSGHVYFYYNDPRYGAKGTFTLKLYIGYTLIAEKSVRIK